MAEDLLRDLGTTPPKYGRLAQKELFKKPIIVDIFHL